MRAELRELVTQIDPAFLDESDAWEGISIVRNFSALVEDDTSHSALERSGFKVIMADRAGRPQWVGRCGPLTDRPLEQEARLLELLSRDPASARHVPESRIARTLHLRLHVSRYVGTDSLMRRAERQSPGSWGASVREVAAASALVMARATELMPELTATATPLTEVERLERDFRLIEAHMVAPSVTKPLHAAMIGWETVPLVLQHGDLWSGNALRHADSWLLIDFDECGLFFGPMHDLLHLVSSGPKRAQARPWYALARGVPCDEWGLARHSVVDEHATRIGLDAGMIGASLIAYLVRLLAYRLRPEAQQLYTRTLVTELHRVSSFLEAGNSREDLIPRP